MNLPLHWEFPGGKFEKDETLHECLQRELQEELGIDIQPLQNLTPNTHEYNNFIITLYPVICRLKHNQEPRLSEHDQYRWLPERRMNDLLWAPADLPILDEYLTLLANGSLSGV